MTSQLLAAELANLIQESKRKHNDLRQAAEKSLDELKNIRGTSEAALAAELAQRVNFANPFIIACGTRNAKFTGIAVVCLSRLILVGALPWSKLSPVLEALREATSAGLDVQLKILQALPTLLQNYANDIKGDLLVTALNICFILQTSKNGVVSNTSAATLQQLVMTVFEKVTAEDKSTSEAEFVGDAPVGNGSSVRLRAAAMDAHRVFKDICLMTENQRPEYLRFTGLPQTFGLELIESVLSQHPSLFLAHTEQAYTLRTKVMPFIINSLNGRPNFATSVRLVRILYTLLKKHLSILPTEGADALDVLTQLLDQDAALWRRALCMEVFRGIFSEPSLLRRIFTLYDAKGERSVLKKLTGTFVRVSTEKPSVIGLGHYSTIPVADPYANMGTSSNQAILESSGVTGIIGGSVNEGHNTGISSQWSTVRVACIDQLDKTEPPAIPESYTYALTLSCITSLSEGLAKFILPLTVPGDARSRKKATKHLDTGKDSPAPTEASNTEGTKLGIEKHISAASLERSASFKKNPIPVNPLTLKDHPFYADIRTCADIIEECWPAILATCSTFLYAALDSEYYHGLVRAFQKFAHVAGLLQLSTPRDAFLTTLGKAAVPPNVFTACLNTGTSKPTPSSPIVEASNTILSNARGLLSVENLVIPVGAAGERQRQASFEASAPPQTLNTRNLLCMRALLNLGIALGPTLSASWSIILETLQQADFVLFTNGKVAGKTPIVSKISDSKAEAEAAGLFASFSTEIKAVETAASRLLESTVDFPNNAFVEIAVAVCRLLQDQPSPTSDPISHSRSSSVTQPSSAGLRMTTAQLRKVSGLTITPPSGPNQQDLFALAKIGDLAIINLDRLILYPPDVSGWDQLTSEIIQVLGSSTISAPVRARAAEIIIRLMLDAAKAIRNQTDETRATVQLRILKSLRASLDPLEEQNRVASVTTYVTDIEIHRIILEGLKSLLDECGETLLRGWNVIFEIIGTIFTSRIPGAENSPDDHTTLLGLTTRSPKLIRFAFGSLQLVCSDFLASLPKSCFLILVDTLYKFCSQDDDLNIALTTVTFFWDLSNFLSSKNKALPITNDLVGDFDDTSLIEKASHAETAASDAALWMLLLIRLTTVSINDKLDLRNSAIQTLLRIFDAYGDQLTPEAWSVCIKAVVFRLLASIEAEMKTLDNAACDEKVRRDWHDTSVVVLNGISNLLSNYLDVLTAHPTFNSYWQQLLGHFAVLLDLQVLDINTATFKALTQMLSQSQNGSKQNFNKTTIDLAWDLWARGIPVTKLEGSDKAPDNQSCLLAYVAALRDVYRLIQDDLTVERISRMLTLLREVMEIATPSSFLADIDHATPLQSQVLDVLKIIRTDIPGAPSALISQISEFVSLAFADGGDAANQRNAQKRTYVAMSKASMVILESLVQSHAMDSDIYIKGALLTALTALSRPIVFKYQFPILTKSEKPWKQATKSAISILGATMDQLVSLDIPRAILQATWHMLVVIANGVTDADCEAPADRFNISDDEAFDITSFMQLKKLIVPALGAEVVPEKTRQLFAESLFRMSIIHEPAPAESSLVYGQEGGKSMGLSNLYKSRRGRTIDPSPSKRREMCYVCLDELFSLVTSQDETVSTQITTQPSTPKFPPPTPSSGSAASEPPRILRIRLARTVAPYLILRAALTLRTYVADQPLRGRMPQPLSQREELARILERLVNLKSEPEAIPDTPNVESEKMKHLLRLYPLIVSATRVSATTGDAKISNLLTEALGEVGAELGMCM